MSSVHVLGASHHAPLHPSILPILPRRPPLLDSASDSEYKRFRPNPTSTGTDSFESSSKFNYFNGVTTFANPRPSCPHARALFHLLSLVLLPMPLPPSFPSRSLILARSLLVRCSEPASLLLDGQLGLCEALEQLPHTECTSVHRTAVIPQKERRLLEWLAFHRMSLVYRGIRKCR